ncbi:hypothetical protein FKW77_005325 [Venturia effusa]|uniref:ribonuclease Z n=1 Tax=Venturia effusa TaxID=50376 RepID=A0A517LQ56_9PEZI|nr:hypothetical protein FKW77_005325 [Venturia effusa]
MANSNYPAMSYQPSNKQYVDPSDMDNWVDFGSLTSPNPNGSSSRQPASAMTSPASTIMPLDGSDDHQTPVAPSHDYSRFKQQTGLPTGSMATLQALPTVFPSYNSGIDDFAMAGSMYDQSGLGGMAGEGFDSDLPAFFFPGESQNDDFVDPSAVLKQEEAQANVRYYPGMHQQAALRAQQQAQQQRQQQMMAMKQREAESQQNRSRRASHNPAVDPHTEETIARVVNQIRQSSNMGEHSMSPDPLGHPHMGRSRKDEEDMDEDERLLNSEEGKKLSSKERRQLRNKVSARAFRSRRKEYIGQLEGEVQGKVNECNDLKMQNRALMEENARFRTLAEKLLAHAAFRPFLEELSHDPELAHSLSAISNHTTTSAPQPKKDADPYTQQAHQYQQQHQHVGMTMIPETQLDFSTLNIGGNQWAMPSNSMGQYLQPQVFTVEVPEMVEPLDIAALSGKSDDIIEEFTSSSDVKADLPTEIEIPSISSEEAEVEETSGIESHFDENDPAYTLFATSLSSAPVVSVSAEVSIEDLAARIPTEKEGNFELVTSSDICATLSMEKSIARMDAACKQLDSLFDSFARRRVRPDSIVATRLIPYLQRRTIWPRENTCQPPKDTPILPSIAPPKPVPDKRLVDKRSVVSRLSRLLKVKQVKKAQASHRENWTSPRQLLARKRRVLSKIHSVNSGKRELGIVLDESTCTAASEKPPFKKAVGDDTVEQNPVGRVAGRRKRRTRVVRKVISASNSTISSESDRLVEDQARTGASKTTLGDLLARINTNSRGKLRSPSHPVSLRRRKRSQISLKEIPFSDDTLTAAFRGPSLHIRRWRDCNSGTGRTSFLRHKPGSHSPYLIPGENEAVPKLTHFLDPHAASLHNPSTMRAHIEFVTVPTADTPGTALYLAFDQKRYLIGQIGEGLQRATVQDGFGMKKIRDVLVTGNTNLQSTGGLIGLILTLADVTTSARANEEAQGKKKKKGLRPQFDDPSPKLGKTDEGLFLSLYGPQNLAGTLAAARRFVFRKAVPIKVHEIKSEEADRNAGEPSWSDELVKVWAFAVTPKAGEREADHGPRNSLKRTFDEANGAEAQSPDRSEEDDRQRQKQFDQIRHGIVADMFGSKWRMDTLVEKRLDEVKLPAKIWVRNPDTRELDEYKGPLPGGTEPLPNPMPVVFTRNPWPGALVKDLPPTSPCKAAVSYIVIQHPRRGKFNIEAAKKLPIGRLEYSLLASGQEVKGSDGSTITPAMVLGPEQPGKGVAIIDLPALEYVQELVDRPEWQFAQVADHLGAIVWILGRGVADSPVLREFMEARKHMEHIVSSPDFIPNSLCFDSVSTSAIKLAAIDMTTFPVPYHDNKLLPQRTCGVGLASVQDLPSFVRVAQRGQRVQIEPEIKVLEDEVKQPLDTLSLIRENNAQEIMDLAQAARTAFQASGRILETEAWVSQVPLPDVEITTLGTGSALPSKYRNVSSTLVRVPGHGSYLFDAGENTLGQLRRVFTPTELEEVLRDLRMIWLSHLHADHHLGTSSVIKAWHQIVHADNSAPPMSNYILDELKHDADRGEDLRGRYLTVVSEFNMLRYLEEYDQIENFGYSHILPLKIVPANFTTKAVSTLAPVHRHLRRDQPPLRSGMMRAITGIDDIQAVFVSHCLGAMAVSVTFPSGTEGGHRAKLPFKISYSGDCRPSRQFARIGHDSTVLIHEATFEDELRNEASAKRHSTVSEALAVGSLMRAKAVVLTHFSQRYSKIPIVDGFWDDRSDIEMAIEGGEEEQDQNRINDGEDEIRGFEEEARRTRGRNSQPTFDPSDRSRAADIAANIFEKPLGPWDGGEHKDDMKVAIAFDYMKFKIRDLPRMEALRPALAKLFEQDIGSETPVRLKETKRTLKQKEEAMKQWKEKNGAENGKTVDKVEPSKEEEGKTNGGNTEEGVKEEEMKEEEMKEEEMKEEEMKEEEMKEEEMKEEEMKEEEMKEEEVKGEEVKEEEVKEEGIEEEKVAKKKAPLVELANETLVAEKTANGTKTEEDGKAAESTAEVMAAIKHTNDVEMADATSGKSNQHEQAALQ